MNWCRETVKMVVPPGNRPAVPRDWTRGVPERYVAGCDTRGRPEGRPHPRSQQVIHEISGLVLQFVQWGQIRLVSLKMDSRIPARHRPPKADSPRQVPRD
jgi:hypothetical protein